MPEKEIIHQQRKLGLPVLRNPCPANGHTKRQEMKELLAELGRRYPRLQENMLAALRNDAQYGLWEKDDADAKQELTLGSHPLMTPDV
jgi:tRNA(Ile)-lysidine synthase TilS/MesJ